MTFLISGFLTYLSLLY